jgi:hypothetical protein
VPFEPSVARVSPHRRAGFYRLPGLGGGRWSA